MGRQVFAALILIWTLPGHLRSTTIAALFVRPKLPAGAWLSTRQTTSCTLWITAPRPEAFSAFNTFPKVMAAMDRSTSAAPSHSAATARQMCFPVDRQAALCRETLVCPTQRRLIHGAISGSGLAEAGRFFASTIPPRPVQQLSARARTLFKLWHQRRTKSGAMGWPG